MYGKGNVSLTGVGRMWEGTRTVGETRDEGDPSGASQRVSK